MRKVAGIMIALVLIITAIPLAASADEAQILDNVVISPAAVTISVNGTQQFTAEGKDSTGALIPGLSYTWNIISGGGIINDTGLFTAGVVVGTYADTVQVSVTQGSITKIAYGTVIITEEQNEEESGRPYGWSQGKKNGWGDKDTPSGWSNGKKTGWAAEDSPPGWSKVKAVGQRIRSRIEIHLSGGNND